MLSRDGLSLSQTVVGSRRDPRFGRTKIFGGPSSRQLLELSCIVEVQLVLNFFAVGFDCLAAKVKLLSYLARSICSAQKLEDLHLTIGQALDAFTRRNRFFAQGPLHHSCGDSFTEIQFAGEDFAQ